MIDEYSLNNIKNLKLTPLMNDFKTLLIENSKLVNSQINSFFQPYLSNLKDDLKDYTFNCFILYLFLDNNISTNNIDKLFYFLIDNNYDDNIILNLFKKEFSFYAFKKLLYSSKLFKYLTLVSQDEIIEFITFEGKNNQDIVNYLLINIHDENFFYLLKKYYLKNLHNLNFTISYFILLNERNYSFNYELSKELLDILEAKEYKYRYDDETLFYFMFACKQIHLKEDSINAYIKNSKCIDKYDYQYSLLSTLDDQKSFNYKISKQGVTFDSCLLYFFNNEIKNVESEQLNNKINQNIEDNLEDKTYSYNFILSLFCSLKYNYFLNYYNIEKDKKVSTFINFYIMFLLDNDIKVSNVMNLEDK